MVASPVHVTVELDPPTRAPIVPVIPNGPENAWEVVATLPNFAGVPLVVVQNGSCPSVSPVEVAKKLVRYSVPDVVIVPPASPLVLAIEVTVPEPLDPTQTPFFAKHPFVILIPLEPVEVAPVAHPSGK